MSQVVPLTQLEKGPQKEFDLVVKVAQVIKAQDNMIEVRLVDEGNEVWYTQIFRGKFKWLREGQYVKVKNASLAEDASHRINLWYSSNILTIPNDSAIVR